MKPEILTETVCRVGKILSKDGVPHRLEWWNNTVSIIGERLVAGHVAIFYIHDTGELVSTSIIERVSVYDNRIELVTENSVYDFRKMVG